MRRVFAEKAFVLASHNRNDHFYFSNQLLLTLKIIRPLKQFVILLTLLASASFAFGNLTPSAASLDFGAHVQGSTSPPQTLTLTNTGSSSITISDIRLVGIHPGEFSHDFSGSTSLNSGGSLNVQLSFAPGIWGHRVATLLVEHDGPNGPLSISLSGDGTEDCSPWTTLSNAVDKRLESVMEIVDGKMYVFASYIDHGGPNLAIDGLSEVYDPDTDTWARIATMPNPVSHAGSTIVGDDIWIVGGFENWPRINTTDVQIYHTKTNTWSAGPAIPAPRNTASVEYLGGKVYVFGGFRFDPNDFSNEEDVVETIVYDLDEPGNGWQTLADMPQPRNHQGSAVVAGKIYCLGGQQNHNVGGNDTDYVHEYDPLTNTWTQKASIPFAFSHNEPATFNYQGQIIMAGGRTFGQPGLDRVMSYDPFTDSWTQICDLPIAVVGAEAGVIDGTLYLAHGASGTSGQLLDSAFSKSFTHTSSAQMAFYPNTLATGLDKGLTESGEVTLFTLSGEADYAIDPVSVPSWMTIDKNLSGQAKPNGIDVEYTIYTNSLDGGVYTANLRATAAGYPDAEVDVALVVNDNSLPVELVDFQVQLFQGESHLRWQTSSELNSSHYVVERRQEQEALFKAVAQVEAAGNSQQLKTYELTDNINGLPRGQVYYRLKSVDLDGSFAYSEVRSVNFEPEQVELHVFPNPNPGQYALNIYVPRPQDAKLQLLDSNGRQLWSRRLSLNRGRNPIDVSQGTLPTGIYVMVLTSTEGLSYTRRMIVR